MCAILTNGTHNSLWMIEIISYMYYKRIRKQEERLESNQYHSHVTHIKFRELRLPIAHSPLWLYNMTNTKKVSVCCFRTFTDVLRCGRLARLTCSLLRSLSLCLCRQFRVRHGSFYPLSRLSLRKETPKQVFRYSASSGGGLGLLVSRRPICLSSVCQQIKERLYFVVGSGATRKNFPRLGHNVLNKMASSRIFKALTNNCALSIVLCTSNRAFRPCKTRLSSQICGKFYQIITINLNQLQTVVSTKTTTNSSRGGGYDTCILWDNCLFNLWLTNYERCIYLYLTLWKKSDPHVLTFAPLRVVLKACDRLATPAGFVSRLKHVRQ